MATMSKPKRESQERDSLFANILKYGLMAIISAFGLVLIYGLIAELNYGLAFFVGVIVVGANIIFIVPSLYPLRWMAVGLAFVVLLVIYPIAFTVSNSFTNYGDGHLFVKSRTIELILDRKFVSDTATAYSWELMRNAEGNYALWLTRDNNGTLEVVFAPEGAPITTVEGVTVADAPETYEGYMLLSGADRATGLAAVENAIFGIGDDTAGIRSRREAARPLESQYVYDAEADTMTDQATGVIYIGDDELGVFRPQNGQGDNLLPGYTVNVGIFNFTRLFQEPALRGPFVNIFVWTIAFAALSVITTFVIGLGMALILNDPGIPGRKFIRSLLIIPYAIPGVISILVWRGLLNENLGLINTTLVGAGLIEQGIPFLNDAFWSKFAIILVNLWLGYPYMMLVCSGALQAIPSDVYEAAAVDGATSRQSFWSITLPLLLVTIGPLLLSSFTFNFNNFLLIDALTSGNPPIPGSPVPAGFTDILISYTYRISFGNRGADYGYASAITIMIFMIVAVFTLIQFRITRTWEEVGENV
jgi:arabinogalactan oligomer / maltooligosaccharide transport system permease protein